MIVRLSRYCSLLTFPQVALTLCVASAHAQLAVGPTYGLAVASHVKDLEITRLAQLPKAPASASSREDCGVLNTPASDEGKAVAALGWGVTAESTLGDYQAVSFAGQFEASTSGTCQIDQGNVAIFKNSHLVALIYATRKSKTSIARIAPAGDGLRILDGNLVSMPVGDLRLADNGALEVIPLPAEEPVCGGRAVVPNLYGKPIAEARKAVMAKGWTPFPTRKSTPQDPVTEDLHQQGIIEATGCSGTGLAFCSYYYQRDDMELDVTSYSDEKPTVSNTHVACDKTSWRKN